MVICTDKVNDTLKGQNAVVLCSMHLEVKESLNLYTLTISVTYNDTLVTLRHLLNYLTVVSLVVKVVTLRYSETETSCKLFYLVKVMLYKSLHITYRK